MPGLARVLLVASVLLSLNESSAAGLSNGPSAPLTAEQPYEKIAAYVPRFERRRPLIAVVGENHSTVLIDFVIPYSVLVQSDIADVVSVATQPGALNLPPLRIDPDATVAQFDERYPEGADYVFVPAVMKNDDAALIAWVSAQAVKGATMVSICNGSVVLANAGLTRGHSATGHWSTYDSRVKKFPDTHWLQNMRYVADGKIISSAGISAALPVSLALVEAIAGTAHAQVLAKQLGVGYWGVRHNSEVFHIGPGDYLTGFSNSALHARQDIGVPLVAGVDDIALALTADAYSDTMRANVYSVAQSSASVKTRSGLRFIPDRIAGQGKPLDMVMPEFDTTPSAQVQDQVIADITRRYGPATARFITLDWEYSSNAQ
jgi:putative intracellular protease/amidase